MTQHTKPGKTIPISLRLTEAELARLKRDAASKSISSHIRRSLFGSDARIRAIRIPLNQEAVFGRILALLGRSEAATSLRELAEAVRIGALPVTPEIEAALRGACDSIDEMRDELMSALGLRKGSRE